MFSAFGIGLPSLGPDDVSVMQNLVKDYCLTKEIELDSEEGRDVARELLKWFQIGVTDKSRLQELLASRT
ncbi:acetyltransferase (plasmid) [Rhizobium leguminosarum]